jgi:3D (Asp-Asp-Asp) domain-containing protein
MRSSGLKTYCSFALPIICSFIVSGFSLNAQSVSAPAKPADTQSATSALVAANAPAASRTSEAVPAPATEPRVGLQHPQLSLEITPGTHRLALPDDLTPSDEDLDYAPLNFKATAYSLRGRTRSGAGVRRGVIAADPRVLPLGTVVQLKAGENYSGVYTVHDTGSAIKGRKIDIWMPSSHEARRFGRQRVKLVVLKYPHGRKPAKTGRAKTK